MSSHARCPGAQIWTQTSGVVIHPGELLSNVVKRVSRSEVSSWELEALGFLEVGKGNISVPKWARSTAGSQEGEGIWAKGWVILGVRRGGPT